MIKIHNKNNNVCLISLLLYLIILCEFGFFYLINFPAKFYSWNSSVTKYLIAMLTLVLFLFCYCCPKYIQLLKKRYCFTIGYLALIGGCLIISSLYAWACYNVSIKDLVLVCVPYILLILSFPLIIKFHNDKGIYIFFNICNLFFTIWIIISLLENVIYFSTQGHILKNYLQHYFLRNNVVRVLFIPICYLLLPYNFFEVYSFNEKSNIIAKFNLFVGSLSLLIIDGTRTYMIIIFLSFVAIFLTNKSRKKSNKKIMLTILFIVIIAFLCSPYFRSFIMSFSTDLSNSLGKSTRIRLLELKYYISIFLNNPLLGFGNIPYNIGLNEIVCGPDKMFWMEDVGFFGLIARFGLGGFLMYGSLIIRQIYILYRIKQVDNSLYSLLVGFFVFTILSSATVIILDTTRMLLFPIILATFEFLYTYTFSRRLQNGSQDEE